MTSESAYWLHALFDICLGPRIIRAVKIMLASAIHLIRPIYSPGGSTAESYFRSSSRQDVAGRKFHKSMDTFAAEVRRLLSPPGVPAAVLLNGERTSRLHGDDHDSLLRMSERIQEQYQERLQVSDISMLPSYQHTLPTGSESGDVLALDVGGSTFRIALIQLNGGKEGGEDALQVRSMRSFVIDEPIRRLEGQAFFDWMAERIGQILVEYNDGNDATQATLPMGLAWSFPIDQTSPQTGNLLAMGKGFCATVGVEGQDLSALIMKSCRAKGINVEMRAIVNDGAATLLSQAYRDPSTRMSLILGTGTNAAVYMPVAALGKDKFGLRPDSWHAAAKHVIVNTEISMFGKGILPVTPYDELLNTNHILPDFQPLEYLITGRYLGEIVRLIWMEAISSAGLFDGQIPSRLDQPYALDTRVLAEFELDQSPSLSTASQYFLKSHPLPTPPTQQDLNLMRETSALVSHRASIYLATALHALWSLWTTAEGLAPGQASHVTVACDGTIVEKYPGFRQGCQKHLDLLCERSGAAAGAVTLKMAPESSVFGAAVAACCMHEP